VIVVRSAQSDAYSVVSKIVVCVGEAGTSSPRAVLVQPPRRRSA
jgi:hypothetical protein